MPVDLLFVLLSPSPAVSVSSSLALFRGREEVLLTAITQLHTTVSLSHSLSSPFPSPVSSTPFPLVCTSTPFLILLLSSLSLSLFSCYVSFFPTGGPPPEKRISLSSIQAPRIAMKSPNQEVQDEPYGWTAREFMRNRLIGQQVEFKVDYSINNREYGTVRYNGENVAVPLLKQGLAKLRPSRNPPCAPDYEGR